MDQNGGWWRLMLPCPTEKYQNKPNILVIVGWDYHPKLVVTFETTKKQSFLPICSNFPSDSPALYQSVQIPSPNPSHPSRTLQTMTCRPCHVESMLNDSPSLSWAQLGCSHKISRNLAAATQWPITCHSYYSFWVWLEVEEKGKKQVVDSSAKSIGLYGGFHNFPYPKMDGL